MVEHAIPLLVLGTEIVPVTPLGTGVTPGDALIGKSVVPTAAPGTIPSEEVAPIGGVTVPTWDNAGLQHNKDQAAAAINNGFMDHFPPRAEGLCCERPGSTQRT